MMSKPSKDTPAPFAFYEIFATRDATHSTHAISPQSVLDVPTLDTGSSKVYDRLIVPVSRALEARVGAPAVGKNLVAVARRPPDSFPRA